MRVVITGASGTVGSEFIREYSDRYDITALTRDASKLAGLKGATVVQTGYDREDLAEIFSSCGAVVHLAYAMATRENEDAGIAAYESSMQMTENILQAAAAAGAGNVIFTSSRLVYPRYKETPFLETDPAEPVNHYGRSKAMMEELCERYNRDQGLSVKCLRLGQVLGTKVNPKSLFGAFLTNADSGLPLRLIGSNTRDYIYVKDVCRAICCAAEHPEKKGIYNISMGQGVDNVKMADEIIRALNSSSSVEADADPQNTRGDNIVLDCSKAERDLGFKCEYDSIGKIVKDIIKE